MAKQEETEQEKIQKKYYARANRLFQWRALNAEKALIENGYLSEPSSRKEGDLERALIDFLIDVLHLAMRAKAEIDLGYLSVLATDFHQRERVK